MNKGWTNRRIAQENQYFRKKNQEALEKIRIRVKARAETMNSLSNNIEIERNAETRRRSLKVEKEITDISAVGNRIGLKKSDWKEALRMDIE